MKRRGSKESRLFICVVINYLQMSTITLEAQLTPAILSQAVRAMSETELEELERSLRNEKLRRFSPDVTDDEAALLDAVTQPMPHQARWDELYPTARKRRLEQNAQRRNVEAQRRPRSRQRAPRGCCDATGQFARRAVSTTLATVGSLARFPSLMASEYVPVALAREVRTRARNRCEYLAKRPPITRPNSVRDGTYHATRPWRGDRCR